VHIPALGVHGFQRIVNAILTEREHDSIVMEIDFPRSLEWRWTMPSGIDAYENGYGIATKNLAACGDGRFLRSLRADCDQARVQSRRRRRSPEATALLLLMPNPVNA